MVTTLITVEIKASSVLWQAQAAASPADGLAWQNLRGAQGAGVVKWDASDVRSFGQSTLTVNWTAVFFVPQDGKIGLIPLRNIPGVPGVPNLFISPGELALVQPVKAMRNAVDSTIAQIRP
ncbi:hypothetical protein llap_16753 [Limosa lapponica baueri]|uniref:Uncharacterized protein n=1 Tax=Limosa lapponica baueri TaxID=1758121 RepID=A0A2I0TGL2_LIMLA|nr:hypothetical protein llap_16753 [Limosa lapponica baueri]